MEDIDIEKRSKFFTETICNEVYGGSHAWEWEDEESWKKSVERVLEILRKGRNE